MELKIGKLNKIKVKNFGILKDVETTLEKFTLFLGKNKVGKTTLIEALKRVEYLATNDVPNESNNFYQFLKKLDKNDESPVSFELEFEVSTVPINFSGIYSYFIELDLNGIIKEEIKVLDGEIHKLFQGQEKPISLVTRENNQIKYYRMKLNSDKSFMFDRDEIIRNVTIKNIPCVRLLWDDGREPYMFYVREMLKSVGGYFIKFVVRATPHLLKKKTIKTEIIDDSDELSLILHSIKMNDQDVFEKLEYIMYLLYSDFNGFEIPEEDFWGVIYMVEKKGDSSKKIPNYYISKGTRELILNLVTCLLAEKRNRNQLVILEEIETSLHPILLEKFIDILSSLKIQIIATSHSPVVLNYLEEADVKIMYEENGDVKIYQGYNKKVLAEDFDLDIKDLNIGEYWIRGNDSDLIIDKR